MKTKMFHSFGSGAASILFGLGQFYGSEAMDSFAKLQKKEQKTIDIFQVAIEFGRATGWGKITPTFSSDMLTINVENCCFCDGMKMSTPVCYEFAGIISETLSSLAKENISIKEMQCIGKGDSVCKFEATITKSLRDALRTYTF